MTQDGRIGKPKPGMTKTGYMNARNMAITLSKYLDGDAVGAFLSSLWRDGVDPNTGLVVDVPIRLTALRLHMDRALGAVVQSVTLQADLDVTTRSLGMNITGMSTETRAQLREILRRSVTGELVQGSTIEASGTELAYSDDHATVVPDKAE